MHLVAKKLQENDYIVPFRKGFQSEGMEVRIRIKNSFWIVHIGPGWIPICNSC